MRFPWTGAGAGSDDFETAGSGTTDGCWTWARCRPSTSATSAADWNRAAGSFACNFSTTATSQSGTSGLVSRIGFGVSSHTRLSTPMLVLARDGGRPVHIAYSTLPRLNRSDR